MMKAVKILAHMILSLTAAFLLAGVPALYVLNLSEGSGADAVSGASVKLPEKPSGDYVILLNRTLHEDTLDDWIAFFRDGELNVIFDDISCMAARPDSHGIRLAKRFQAELPENQMRLHTEDPTLLVSKAENGCIDAAVFSQEMADSLRLKTDVHHSIVCITIKGGEKQ